MQVVSISAASPTIHPVQPVHPQLSKKEKLTIVVKEIFKEVIPHLIQIAPIYLNKMINLKILGIIGYIFTLDSLCKQLSNASSRLEQFAISIQLIACVAGIIAPLYSGGLILYLSIEALTILSNAIGNATVLKDSFNKLKEVYNAENLTQGCYGIALKVAKIASMMISLTIAICGISNTFDYTSKLIKGYSVLNTLDSVQQHFVIKHRVLHAIGEKKALKAVIIDGLSSKWGKGVDDRSNTDSQFLYENTETRTYHVSSSQEFSEVLGNATKEMGKLDLLVINGHGNKFSIKLGADYFLTAGSELEMDAIRKFCKERSHLYLAGCNTAADRDPNIPSLTEYFSNCLRNIKVTGYRGYVNPFLLTFSKENMAIESHYPFGIDGMKKFWSGFFTAKTFNV